MVGIIPKCQLKDYPDKAEAEFPDLYINKLNYSTMEKLVNKLINAYKELALLDCDSKYDVEVNEYKQRLREMIYTLTD